MITPLAPTRFKVQVTIGQEAHDLLRRAQDLLRHSIPNGDPAKIVERALAVLVAQLEKQKFASSDHPRTAKSGAAGSRHIPASVKREVWRRDGGRCTFVGADGPCRERGFIEFHHVVPFAAGGETTVGNLQLRCRAHNAHEAGVYFGKMFCEPDEV